MSEDGQIRQILGKIEVVPANKAVAGDSKFVVGRVVLAAATSLIAPVSQKKCAYYEVTCERLVTHTDQEGHTTHTWEHFFTEIQKCDFFLADPSAPQGVYVPGTNHNMKMYSVEDAGGAEGGMGSGFFSPEQSDTNPHLQALLNRHGADGGFMGGPKIRYREGCFAVNEQVAVLGTAVQSSINGVPVLLLNPCKTEAYTEAYFEQHQWNGLDIGCWQALTKDSSLIGTDDPKYMRVRFYHAMISFIS
jgi:hypothetical protein